MLNRCKYLLWVFLTIPSFGQNIDVSRVRGVGYVSDESFLTLPAACASAVSQGLTLQVSKSWSALTTQSLACSLTFVTGGIIQPANGQTVTLLSNSCPVNQKCYDVSAAGTIAFTNPSPMTYPESWGGGVNIAATDTAAENAAIASMTATVNGPCGTLLHNAAHVYALGAINPITCGIIEGNRAVIKPSTTGAVFTLNQGTVPVTAEEQFPIIRGFNWQTGTATPANLILVNTAVDSIIENNVFGVISAGCGIRNLTFGSHIQNNLFGSGNTWTTGGVCIDQSTGSSNAVRVTGNDFTQQTGVCIWISGGQELDISANITEGCTGGGVLWTGSFNIIGMRYDLAYNELNTGFDLKFTDTTAQALGVTSSGAFFAGGNCTNCLQVSSRTSITLNEPVFSGSCADTTATGLTTLGAYRSIHAKRISAPAGCNGVSEGTANLIARIPAWFIPFGTNDDYRPPTSIYGNRPACSSTTAGYTTLISNGITTATWGADLGGLGTAANILICDGTGWTVIGR